jgi:mannose-1-phosphate guanylyltransferase
MEVEDPSAYGLVLRDPEDRVTDFIEKPKHAPPGGAFVNAGAYVLEHDVLDLVANEGSVSFEREVFPALVARQELYAHATQGYWLDIGTPERYLEATRHLLERSLSGDIAVGEECHIESGAHVGPLSVLGDLCRVEAGAVIERAVLFDRAQVERDAVVRDSVIGNGATIGAGARLEQETIVADGARVEPGAVLTSARVER